MGMTILEGLRLTQRPEFPLSLLDEVVPIRVQNVAQYLFEHKAADYPVVELPTVVAPWPLAFYEFSVGGVQHGVLMRTHRMSPAPFYMPDDENALGMGEWACETTFFIRGLLDSGEVSVVDRLILVLGEGGAPLGRGVDLCAFATGQLKELQDEGVEGARQLWRLFGFSMRVSLFANCFAHCKNVEILDAVPPPKLSAKQEKRYGIPKLTYKTLNIVPMQQTLRSEGGMDRGNSLAKALHICRGHFADYRDGPGLFGRYHGLVWRDMHVRGDKKAGRVVKDYEVRTA